MEREQRTKCLSRIDLFQSFTEYELSRFAEGITEFSCQPGTVLFTEGETGRDMYILLEGELEVLKAGRVIATINPVEPVGEMAVIDQMPRSATVQAASECFLFRISADHFQEVTVRSDSLLSMMRALSRRIRKDSERIAQDYEKANILIHDMRNILSTFVLVDLLRRKVTDEPAERMVAAMRKARDNLAEMMEEALAAARHIARPFIKGKASLVNLIREMAETEFPLHPDLASRSIELNLDEDLPEFVFNSLAIRRVILNLVLNGAQAGKVNDSIVITLKRYGELVKVSVMDRGCGIPESLRQVIFNRQITTKEKGTGLGLLSCAGIIEQHSGKFDVVSEEGLGSTVSFFLPIQ